MKMTQMSSLKGWVSNFTLKNWRNRENDAIRKGKAIAEVDTDGTYVASETKILETENIKDFATKIAPSK